MKCPNCKATIDDNSKFCDYCGKEIKNEQPTIKKEEITKEEYHKNFIGDNYYTFKNKFNIAAFILGGLYLFYRKQYIFGTIFIIITVLTIFITPLIAIIFHLLLGIAYNNQYISYVNKKTNEIKIKNINKPKEEILAICKEKGGTSIISSVGSIILILLLIIIILNVGGTNIKTDKGKTLVKVSNNKISSMIFEVPKGFESSNYNTDTYRAYTYNKAGNYCRIKIQTTKKNNKYSSVEGFLSNTVFTNKTDIVTTPENVNINKQLWKRISVSNARKTTTYYATEYNKIYYVVSYELYNKNEFCNQEYNTFMNSLNYRD